MVRANPEFSPLKDLLENRFPNAVHILKAFIATSVPPTGEDRAKVRKAFRDVGLFELLNQERGKNGDDPYERVADVTWLEIAVITEQRLQKEETTKQQVNEQRVDRLVKLAERDAEEETEAEAKRLEDPDFVIFEPMSRGPEERKKWNKHVPYKYLPINRTSHRKGAPTEIEPEEYQRLKKERSVAIKELFEKNLKEFRNKLASEWLQKKYPLKLVSEYTKEDMNHALSAADANMDATAIIRLRCDTTFLVDYKLGWHKIVREEKQKPRTEKKR